MKKKSSSSGLFFGKLALMKLVLNEAGKSLKQQIPCPVSCPVFRQFTVLGTRPVTCHVIKRLF